jgi:hypothetical protein
MWNLISAHLEIVLVLVQDRCTVCTKRTICLEIVLDAPDGNSLVTWVMWNLASVRLEIVLVSVQDRCTACARCAIVRNHFGRTRWYSLVTRLKWTLFSVRLETVLVSVQDRCMVYAKCTISLGIILDTPDGTPRRRGSSESSIRSIWR